MDAKHIEMAKSILNFDEIAGVFTWKETNRFHNSGDIATKQTPKGYLTINIFSRVLLAHRIAYMFSNGEIGKGMLIDHINGNRSDNRISNLRMVTRSTNCQNRRSVGNRNKSGFLGVSWNKRHKKYRAAISLNKNTKTIGYFDDPAEAHNEYLKWKRMVHVGCTI